MVLILSLEGVANGIFECSQRLFAALSRRGQGGVREWAAGRKGAAGGVSMCVCVSKSVCAGTKGRRGALRGEGGGGQLYGGTGGAGCDAYLAP
jgi:hypothetical protein